MIARLRSWWQKTSKTLDAVVILMLVVLIALVVVIVLGYTNNWNWTGLHGRTLYDWLQLLIIPAVLAAGGYLFNFATSRTEREIASDRQQEEALQAYIDSMSALLLERNLRQSAKDDEVRKIARVRTLTVLPRLNGKRKGSVVQFLYESGLIHKDQKIVDLSQANLREADLSRANLDGADLSEAFLSEARLFLTDLSEADLRETDLRETDLSLANLNGANLSSARRRKTGLSGFDIPPRTKVTDEQLAKAKNLKGAIMPDGTKHD